jgi:hydroxymethylpyrimidine/phosphomethylpyrimidine kinase
VNSRNTQTSALHRSGTNEKEELIPVALTIAGSDNSAGAGIQADLKTFHQLGVYGQTAVTSVVAEVPGKVSRIHPIDPQTVAEQVRLSLEYFPVVAIKTGMLFSEEIIECVCEIFEHIPQEKRPPIVVDPVMVATAGNPLLKEDAIEIYRERLIPIATLVTPNLSEASVLAKEPAITNPEQMQKTGVNLSQQYGVPFLIKGGHLENDEAIDLLIENRKVTRFSGALIRGVHTHGTGCTYSAAITANLALGKPLKESIALSKSLISSAIANSYRWLNGVSALRI